MIVLVLAVLLLWAQGERHSGRNLCSPYFVNEGECVALAPMVGHKVSYLRLVVGYCGHRWLPRPTTR